MSWQIEVTNWISTLQHEVGGLSSYLSQVSTNELKVPDRLKSAIQVLKEVLLNLIDKSNSLLKFSTEPDQKLSNLRKEYKNAMKGLSNLFKSLNDTPKKPHYNYSTYASRKRSLSRIDSSPSKAADTPKTRMKSANPGEKANVSEDKPKILDIKIKLKQLKGDLEKHRHSEYEEKIASLEEENVEIRKKIQKAKEEAKANFRSIEELRNKIDLLEKNRKISAISSIHTANYSPVSIENASYSGSTKKQRFLLKPSGVNLEGNSLLKEFE